jgi:hypothetical protein
MSHLSLARWWSGLESDYTSATKKASARTLSELRPRPRPGAVVISGLGLLYSEPG